MATPSPTTTNVSTNDDSVKLHTWTLTTADTTGVAVEFPMYADLCWHAIGTWGGATAAIQGSNRDTDAEYGALTNASGGAAITWTADGAPKQSIERPRFVRPKLTTPGSGATVVVTLLARKPHQQKF